MSWWNRRKIVEYSCYDVAKYLLKLAKKDGRNLDTLQLLKLTYIVNAYHLGFYDRSLFSNNIEIWKYGPVVPDLYYVIKLFGMGIIYEDSLDSFSEIKIINRDKKFIKLIWNNYNKFNGIELSALCATNNYFYIKNKNNFTNVVDSNTIKLLYKSIINKDRIYGK